MPKRSESPTLSREESKFYIAYKPYPLNGNWELEEDRRDIIHWIASIIGPKWFTGFHYKPKARGMVVLEISRNCPEPSLVALLGEHQWSKMLKDPSAEEQVGNSKILEARYHQGRLLEKDGWKSVKPEDKWFEDFDPRTERFKFPYPIPSWCAPPVEDRTNKTLCKPLPKRIKPGPAQPPPPPVVGTPEWSASRAASITRTLHTSIIKSATPSFPVRNSSVIVPQIKKGVAATTATKAWAASASWYPPLPSSNKLNENTGKASDYGIQKKPAPPSRWGTSSGPSVPSTIGIPIKVSKNSSNSPITTPSSWDTPGSAGSSAPSVIPLTPVSTGSSRSASVRSTHTPDGNASRSSSSLSQISHVQDQMPDIVISNRKGNSLFSFGGPIHSANVRYEPDEVVENLWGKLDKKDEKPEKGEECPVHRAKPKRGTCTICQKLYYAERDRKNGKTKNKGMSSGAGKPGIGHSKHRDKGKQKSNGTDERPADVDDDPGESAGGSEEKGKKKTSDTDAGLSSNKATKKIDNPWDWDDDN